jgi:hypothetical protein
LSKDRSLGIKPETLEEKNESVFFYFIDTDNVLYFVLAFSRIRFPGFLNGQPGCTSAAYG